MPAGVNDPVVDVCFARAYKGGMRKRYINQLVQEASEPLVWALTAQPIILDGWKETSKLPDGAIYARSTGGPLLVMYRGMVDEKGRRWMTLSAQGEKLTMPLLRELRTAFFPERAIVALAVMPTASDIVEMWWGLDEEALPMDPGWKWSVKDPDEQP